MVTITMAVASLCINELFANSHQEEYERSVPIDSYLVGRVAALLIRIGCGRIVAASRLGSAISRDDRIRTTS